MLSSLFLYNLKSQSERLSVYDIIMRMDIAVFHAILNRNLQYCEYSSINFVSLLYLIVLKKPESPIKSLKAKILYTLVVS